MLSYTLISADSFANKDIIQWAVPFICISLQSTALVHASRKTHKTSKMGQISVCVLAPISDLQNPKAFSFLMSLHKTFTIKYTNTNHDGFLINKAFKNIGL